MPTLHHPKLGQTVQRSERQARVLEGSGWVRTGVPVDVPEVTEVPPDPPEESEPDVESD